MKRSPLEFGSDYVGEAPPSAGRDVLAILAVVVISVLTGGAIAGVAYLFTVGP